ncbi:MAG: multidrug ABC transporter ATP-binding protein [Planctomycetes bacterium RBG_16_64_12]|nr:MAG: multidrug ABC transporter ATP-binding protein [Planctomycetes bacterium RBG_16_64_12]
MCQDEPVVVTHELTKKYGRLTALDGLSISLGRGQILGFIGPNGAGKTTTIKILVGLARPTSGWARVAGADCVRDARKIKRLVGYMPDTFGSYDNMRVREYLDFFGAAFRIPRPKRAKRIGEALDTVGAASLQDRYVESLSFGMKQRIGIARTLLHDPQVLFLDEPASGLDPAARIEMRQTLLRLAEAGKTLIVTSHVLPELARICDQVAILTGGKLRAFGTLDQITRSVGQRRAIEAQLAAADQIESTIREIERFVGDGADATGSAAEAVVRFQFRGTESELGELLAWLIGAGVRVTQFRELGTDLEDAFLSIIENEKGAQ